jgi:hypothetical protein
VWSSRRGSRQIEHVGSAHSDDEVAALKQVAAERISAGQGELDLGPHAGPGAGPLEVVESKTAWVRQNSRQVQPARRGPG